MFTPKGLRRGVIICVSYIIAVPCESRLTSPFLSRYNHLQTLSSGNLAAPTGMGGMIKRVRKATPTLLSPRRHAHPGLSTTPGWIPCALAECKRDCECFLGLIQSGNAMRWTPLRLRHLVPDWNEDPGVSDGCYTNLKNVEEQARRFPRWLVLL